MANIYGITCHIGDKSGCPEIFYLCLSVSFACYHIKIKLLGLIAPFLFSYLFYPDNNISYMETFSFKFQQVKAIWYLFLGLIGIPFIAFLSNNAPIGWFLLIILTPMALAFFLFFKKIKDADTITLEDDHINSARFGKIYYADIVSAKSPWLYSTPALQLKLRNGQKITWAASFQNNITTSKQDAQTLVAFTNALINKTSTRQDVLFNQAAADTKSSPIKNINTAPIGQPISPTLHQSLAGAQKRNLKPQWVAIPAGSIIVLLLALKNCGTDYIKKHKDDEVRNILQNSEQQYDQSIQDARKMIDSMTNVLGPVYLYTNDSVVSVHLMPDINTGDAAILDNVPVLQHSLMFDSIKKFIAHPDSFAYKIAIERKANDVAWLQKSVFNYGDSTDTWLYLLSIDPDIDVSKDRAVIDTIHGSGSKPFEFSTGIPVYKNKSLLQSMEAASPNLSMMLARAHFSKNYKLYLVGVRKDNISEALFSKAITVFNKQLAAVKADTNSFHYSKR
ncbi:hypothetical protein [Chitinophaga costaii]|uniref:hypothetical protein n=1 Tax=Chitinophaga costaii TaxID=1335309 RepID=UPI000F4F006B|nr:hypothetical protein [Chitinophaga costaii]